ncbi:hypothetical protein B0H19DRAFT_13374 [Mycena capillaripes]|nr:hypothetical protein B0H19DRAFT_13374 [Mycena capillaripes]
MRLVSLRPRFKGARTWPLDPSLRREWGYERAPTPEVDFFRSWDIPLAAYKGIRPGRRFVPSNPGSNLGLNPKSPLPSHPILDALPSPAGRATDPSYSWLSRTVVVKGIANKTCAAMLDRIHEGALQSAHWTPQPFPPHTPRMLRTSSLTLTFLSNASARAFVHSHLADPARLYEFTRSPNPSWEWRASTLLPTTVANAVATHSARRSLSITWFHPSHRWRRDVLEFGSFQTTWRCAPCRIVLHFYSITSAIRAHAGLSGDRRLRISYFPDPCEIDASARRVFARNARWAHLNWWKAEDWWKRKWIPLQPPWVNESERDEAIEATRLRSLINLHRNREKQKKLQADPEETSDKSPQTRKRAETTTNTEKETAQHAALLRRRQRQRERRREGRKARREARETGLSEGKLAHVATDNDASADVTPNDTEKEKDGAGENSGVMDASSTETQRNREALRQRRQRPHKFRQEARTARRERARMPRLSKAELLAVRVDAILGVKTSVPATTRTQIPEPDGTSQTAEPERKTAGELDPEPAQTKNTKGDQSRR